MTSGEKNRKQNGEKYPFWRFQSTPQYFGTKIPHIYFKIQIKHICFRNHVILEWGFQISITYTELSNYLGISETVTVHHPKNKRNVS